MLRVSGIHLEEVILATWATQRLDDLIAGTAIPPPVIQTLQLGTLESWAPGLVKKRWNPGPDLLNADGSMFGGYIAALADQALAFAAMTVVPADMSFRTANLLVSFIRVAGHAPIHIEGRVVAQTRQLITARAEFRREDGELIAEASAQQFLQPIHRAGRMTGSVAS